METEKCQSFTKKGLRCSRKPKENGYCNQHNPEKTCKTDKSIPRLPEKLKEKLANSSEKGLKKIRDDIVKMWLEDGGKQEILDKNDQKIPVSEKVYKKLLEKFGGEEVVMNQIFTREVKEPKEPKEPIYGSATPPLAPTSLEFYRFMPAKPQILLTEEGKEKFKTLKDFILSRWKEKIHNGYIHLAPKTYENAKKFFRKKFEEINVPSYRIDEEFWLEYMMRQIFRKSLSKPESAKPKPKPKPETKPKPVPKPEPETKPKPIPETKVSVTRENIKTYLESLFPGKDVNLYLQIIQINSSSYPIKSRADIYKLYTEFHPDKCSDIMTKKVEKLCNLFCAKVENIKKVWDHSRNPNVSPIRSRGDDTIELLKIANEKIED